MIKAALFLSALALVQVQSEVLQSRNLWEASEACKDSATFKLLPHEWDCTKFYFCENGLKRIEATSCAPGTEFSESLQVCTHAILANCQLSNVPQSDQLASESETEEDCDEEYLDNGCPSDLNAHKLLPHSDCGRFYQCVHGELVERNCSKGTVFNAAIETCDWPNNVEGCENYVHPESSEEEDDILNNDGNDNGDAGNDTNGNNDGNDNGEAGNDTNGAYDWVALPNGCPADIHIHHLLPHETDCAKFYYCNFGEKVVRDCALGTHFHYEIQVCDWPANVNCALSDGNDDDDNNNDNDDSGNDDNGNNDNDGNGNNDNDDANNDSDSGSEGEILDNGCPADFNVHKLLPHETDCDKFYYCDFGSLVERSCPAGTHFNYEIQVCDWPWAAGCEASSGGGGSCGGDSGNGGGCNDNGNNDNDNGNNDNDNGNNDNGSGDNDNGNNDNDNGNNDNDSGDNDNDNGNNDNDNGDNDDDSGNNDNGNNDNGNGDNDNDNGNNDNGSGDGNDGDNGSGNESGDNDGSGDDSDNGNGCGIQDEDDSTICQNSCNKLPWKHADCDKYYVCNGLELKVITCAEGLQFNPDTLACDFACNVGCVRKSTQVTTVHDGIKVFIPWKKLDNGLDEALLKYMFQYV